MSKVIHICCMVCLVLTPCFCFASSVCRLWLICPRLQSLPFKMNIVHINVTVYFVSWDRCLHVSLSFLRVVYTTRVHQLTVFG